MISERTKKRGEEGTSRFMETQEELQRKGAQGSVATALERDCGRSGLTLSGSRRMGGASTVGYVAHKDQVSASPGWSLQSVVASREAESQSHQGRR